MKQNAKITSEQAKMRLEALCARAEHCTYELQQKLYKWGIEGEEASVILEELKKRGFLNDERFVRSYVHDKMNFAKWGERKIAVSLRAKRINTDLISAALQQSDTQIVEENLLRLLKSKIKTTKADSPQKLNEKLVRFAIGRGYTYEVIKKVLRRLAKD